MIKIIMYFLKFIQKKNGTNNNSQQSTSTNNTNDDCQQLVLDCPSYHVQETEQEIDDISEEEASIQKKLEDTERSRMIFVALEMEALNSIQNNRSHTRKRDDMER